MAIKDQYDTFDMRTTSGADAATPTIVRRATRRSSRAARAGAIILAKANMADRGDSRSPFGGVTCNPYDTERATGTSSAVPARRCGAIS